MKMKILATLLLGLPWFAAAQGLVFGPGDQASVQPADDIALVVNNEAISRSQYNRELQAARAAIPKNSGLSAAEIDDMLKERIIMQHIVAQLAHKAAVELKPEEIDHGIASIAQQNNISVPELYARVQKQTGLNQAQYRQRVAEQMVQSQLRQKVVGRSVHVSPQQINDQIALVARERGATVHVQDLLVPTPQGDADARGPEYQKIITALAAAIKKQGSDNLSAIAAAIPGAKFNDLGDINIGQIPPKFANVVANLHAGEMVSTPIVDADGMHFLKVVSKTAANGQGFMVDQAKVRHILIRDNPSNPGEAKALIQRIYAQLQNGGNFAALAREYSQDPASAANGGDLGWMSADQVVPAFAKAMDSVPLNKISAPFKSAFGWHIIEVSARRSVDRTEDRIRAQIRDSLYAAALEQAWQQKLAQLRQSAYVKFFN